MRDNQFYDDYAEELDDKELIKQSKYIKRNKKMNESFRLYDLLTEEQIQKLHKYMSE